MTRWFILAALLLFAATANAQRSGVSPNDAELIVTIENPQDPFLQSEMVLLTIHGIYRRHVTREKLIQPPLSGFSWMQLGEDYWYDSTENGLKVKNMRRRMAIFPNRAGEIEIGAFVHRLTFLNENLKWFEHEIASPQIVIDVGPAEPTAKWWLPVHRLEIEDNWSNAPDQMRRGQGVLRVIRVEAHGASPDMLPPMPTLRSPTAHIFAHPEKRMVELTPNGPVAIAFWRWTLRPTNDVSAVIEPLEVEFYDTFKRANQLVTITAQRIGYGALTGREPRAPPPKDEHSAGAATIAGPSLMRAGFVIGAAIALGLLLRSLSLASLREVLRRFGLDRDSRALSRAAKTGASGPFRAAARRLVAQNGFEPEKFQSLKALDNVLFSNCDQTYDLKAYQRQVRAELARNFKGQS